MAIYPTLCCELYHHTIYCLTCYYLLLRYFQFDKAYIGYKFGAVILVSGQGHVGSTIKRRGEMCLRKCVFEGRKHQLEMFPYLLHLCWGMHQCVLLHVLFSTRIKQIIIKMTQERTKVIMCHLEMVSSTQCPLFKTLWWTRSFCMEWTRSLCVECIILESEDRVVPSHS